MAPLTMPQTRKVSPSLMDSTRDNTLDKLEMFVSHRDDSSQGTDEEGEKNPEIDIKSEEQPASPTTTVIKEKVPVTPSPSVLDSQNEDTLIKLDYFVKGFDVERREESPNELDEQPVTPARAVVVTPEKVTKETVSSTLSKYEEIIAALPLSEVDSKVVLAGGQLGLLHEVLALRAIQASSSTPLMVYKEEKKNLASQRKYYPQAEVDDAKSVVIANLSAYMYWDYAWNYHRRHVTRRKFENMAFRNMDPGQDCRIWQWSNEVVKSHREWCLRRDINPNAVRLISDKIDETMSVLFETRFEPEWLKCSDATPVWRRFGAWKGDWERDDHFMLGRVYGNYNSALLCDILGKLYDTGGDTKAVFMSALEVVATKGDWQECQVGKKSNVVGDRIQEFIANNSRLNKFKEWNTIRNSRPSPKDFLQGTRGKGGNYVFMHDTDTVGVPVSKASEDHICQGFNAIAPMLAGPVLHGGAYSWFLRKAEHLVLIGEGDFTFTESLFALGHPPFISSTKAKTAPPRKSRRTILSQASLLKRVFTETRRMTSLDATRVHRYSKIISRVENGNARCFAWNFPFNNSNPSDSTQEDMIQSTFSSLATLYDKSMDYEYEIPHVAKHPFLFGVTLHDDQFSRWFVLRAALRTGWRLRSWCPFDYTEFPGYKPCGEDGTPLEVKNARFYVFQYMYCNVL